MNNLSYIYKLWLSVTQASGNLTTSDVLLAAKRLVEGHTDIDISISIDEFDEFAKDISLEETLDYLREIKTSDRYIILINLFMVIMLKSINAQRVNHKQITALKEIYKALDLHFMYDTLYLLMQKKYKKAHKVLDEHPQVHIDFICFDEDAKSELNQSFQSYQVSFIVLHIENFFLLLNSHSHDLNIYNFTNDKELSLAQKCQEFREEPYFFHKHNIRDPSIYYIDENSFIRITNNKEVLYLDEYVLKELFSDKNEKLFSITEQLEDEKYEYQCSIVKDHIFNISAKNFLLAILKKSLLTKMLTST